jgi:hypothetical protein
VLLKIQLVPRAAQPPLPKPPPKPRSPRLIRLNRAFAILSKDPDERRSCAVFVGLPNWQSRRTELRVAQLKALGSSDLLDHSQQLFIDAALEAVVQDVVAVIEEVQQEGDAVVVETIGPRGDDDDE